DHPNILPIYEVSESEDGLPFFSMKFAKNGSLREHLASLRDEPRKCVQLMAKVARAIEYAHSRGVLHRDIKPGNILLNDRGEPLVSDFGLAKLMDGNNDLTRSLTTFGTAGFIAPEQAGHAAVESSPGRFHPQRGCGAGPSVTPNWLEQRLPVFFWGRLRFGYFAANSFERRSSTHQIEVLRFYHLPILARRKIRDICVTA